MNDRDPFGENEDTYIEVEFARDGKFVIGVYRLVGWKQSTTVVGNDPTARIRHLCRKHENARPSSG
jgi:hypothetical protein